MKAMTSTGKLLQKQRWLWLGLLLLLFWVASCVTTSGDSRSNTDLIARSMKSHLKENLDGKSAKLFDSIEVADDDDGGGPDDDDWIPDDDDDDSDTGDGDWDCCMEDDPCDLADNEACDCPEMSWDWQECTSQCCLEEDPCFWQNLEHCLCPDQDWNFRVCQETCCSQDVDTCGWTDNGSCECPTQSWDDLDCQPEEPPDTEGAPVCVEDLASCEAPDDSPDWDPNSDADLLALLDLGWYDDDPPEAKEEPRSRLCFDGTVRIEQEDPLLVQFGVVEEDTLAAFILVLEDLSGFALLPLNGCGQVEFPGTETLCSGIDESVEIPLAAHGALVTFDRTVGPYMDFTLVVVCD